MRIAIVETDWMKVPAWLPRLQESRTLRRGSVILGLSKEREELSRRRLKGGPSRGSVSKYVDLDLGSISHDHAFLADNPM